MKITNDRAVLAQQSLHKLVNKELPVKTSLQIARLSLAIDQQVSAVMIVRDALISQYRIAVNVSDVGTPVLKLDDEISEEEKTLALQGFTQKLNEVMEEEGEEINTTFSLPETISITPDELKPIIGFIE